MKVVVATLAALVLTIAAACGSTSVVTSRGPSSAPTPTPTATATSTPEVVTHDVVYFARDRLPPVGAHVVGAGTGATAEQRIRSRLDALFVASAPAGLFNVARTLKVRPSTVTVDAADAVVDFAVPNDDWGTAGSSGTRAFVQQLIYTITEEPGIERALMTQNGGQTAIVGGEGLVIDHPAGRLDVAGYTIPPSIDPVRSFESEVAPATPTARVTSRYSVDEVAPGLARLVVELTRPGGDPGWLPTFDASLAENGAALGVKHELQLTVFDGADRASDTIVDRTPLRRLKVESQAEPRKTVYRLGLDDLRPWRVGVIFDPVRIVLDIGGDPDAVNANVAVYRPRFAETLGRDATLSGMTRAFEGTFEYRFTDLFGRALAAGYGTASFGTSPIWGAFELTLADIPPETANIEVFLRSPRDGEVTDLVSIAIAVAR
jgi:hypothetical protein